jgi:hypothetical protein
MRRNAGGSCEPGPTPGCLHTFRPERSSVKISSDKQTWSWKWSKGMAVPSRLLGNFSQGSGVQLCIFDGNSNVVFQTWWTPVDTDWPGDSEWETRDGIKFSRQRLFEGKELVKVRPGAEGDTEIRISARDSGLSSAVHDTYPAILWPGGSLPASPFDLPLRIQAQADRGGACFESTFDTFGVRTNDDGRFKARATE